MSTHVLLNLLNELRKSDKMRRLPSILSLFRNEFNKFNKAGARMLDSIYHICLFVFVALRPMSTAMVIAGRSVHLTTLFPGQA